MRVGLIAAALIAMSMPALAQTAGSDSTMCRVFPLACPGPVPPKPAPLLGPPEDQAAAAAPSEQPAAHKHRAHVRKKVVKAKAQ